MDRELFWCLFIIWVRVVRGVAEWSSCLLFCSFYLPYPFVFLLSLFFLLHLPITSVSSVLKLYLFFFFEFSFCNSNLFSLCVLSSDMKS